MSSPAGHRSRRRLTPARVAVRRPVTVTMLLHSKIQQSLCRAGSRCDELERCHAGELATHRLAEHRPGRRPTTSSPTTRSPNPSPSRRHVAGQCQAWGHPDQLDFMTVQVASSDSEGSESASVRSESGRAQFMFADRARGPAVAVTAVTGPGPAGPPGQGFGSSHPS